MYQQRLLACKPLRPLSPGGGLCYTARHASHEKVHQEPQQGQEAGAEAQARAAQQGPAPRHARPV